MAKELNGSNFQSEILDYKGCAVVDFWAPWCGPCRMMTPIIDSLAARYEGKVKIAKVDVEANQELAGKYNVMSIPCIVFFNNGEVVHTHLGATSEAELDKQIKQHFSV